MDREINVGIIGDFDPEKQAHRATKEAIGHAADSLAIQIKTEWLPTPSFLTGEGPKVLERFDGFWASPGNPSSPDGAVWAINRVREEGRPFIGT